MAAAISRYYDLTLPGVLSTWLMWTRGEQGPRTVGSKWPERVCRLFYASWICDNPDPTAVDAFVKGEIGKATCDHLSNPLTKPRLIHTYKYAAAKEFMGREYAAWQRALTQLLDPVSPYVYFADGTTTVTLAVGFGSGKGTIAEWAETRRALWWVESDATSWDAFVNHMMLDYKLSVMRESDERLASYSRAGTRARCNVAGRRGHRLSYDLDGTVLSGFNDTTSGNSLINAALTAKAAIAAGIGADIIVAGDDMLMAVTSIGGTTDQPSDEVILEVTGRFADRLVAYGVKPKWGAFRSVEDTTFCSAGFYRTGGRLQYLPLLGRQLAKLWWTTRKVPPKPRDQYRRSLAKCMLSVVGDFPVYNELVTAGLPKPSLRHLLWPGTSVGYTDELERELGYKPGVGVVGAFERRDALAALERKYGIAPAVLENLCGLLRRAPRGTPCVVGSAVARAIVQADSLDPCDRPSRVGAQ